MGQSATEKCQHPKKTSAYKTFVRTTIPKNKTIKFVFRIQKSFYCDHRNVIVTSVHKKWLPSK